MGRRASRRRGYCPCCGYRTLEQGESGSYERCAICFWHDDPEQFERVDYPGGANRESLREAWDNLREFGWCGRGFRPSRLRKPRCNDQRDPRWPYDA